MLGSTQRQELKIHIIARLLEIFGREHVDGFIMKLTEDILNGSLVYINSKEHQVCSFHGD